MDHILPSHRSFNPHSVLHLDHILPDLESLTAHNVLHMDNIFPLFLGPPLCPTDGPHSATPPVLEPPNVMLMGHIPTSHDTPPGSLMDSNVSPD